MGDARGERSVRKYGLWESGEATELWHVLARRLKKGGVSSIVFQVFGMGGRNGKENGLTQPHLSGLEAEKPEETELANCLVLSRPEYKDTGKKQEWSCALHAQPSIFQPDIDMELIAEARNELATRSRRKSLKPGDRVVLTGVLRVDTLTFPTGETHTINRLALTHVPQMVAREKRVSTTVYEQRKAR